MRFSKLFVQRGKGFFKQIKICASSKANAKYHQIAFLRDSSIRSGENSELWSSPTHNAALQVTAVRQALNIEYTVSSVA